MPDRVVAPRELSLPLAAQAVLPLQLLAVGRSGRGQAPAPTFSFWLQIRGSAQVTGLEGSFRLDAGDWIALERGSAPLVQADDHGLTIGVVMTGELMGSILDPVDRGLVAGRGHLQLPARRTVLQLWRQCVRQHPHADYLATRAALKPLLRQLQQAQQELAGFIERCPGRSYHRKTRIFSRIQRARMYLEGHPQRMLRIEDLMELTRFSSWWLSKTFHAVYQETLQKASMRLRMQRARELLELSQLSISELAESCGFHDPCSFARQFKAWHGETASTWRARHLTRVETEHPGARHVVLRRVATG